ncbi:hypothetical protein OOK60_16855 [Trichothermofontia sichuanensis B231]|uniref:hypothetical protein n=1 Tax=Trichothermofontia sichuanensis TaxID=3045816 RepID=UPI002247370A|nr:hypothetical protein [Trichothermofontia sichuanensis]UZQ54131.1 hypothetical protein OOK60_16855 [Trichothermofontia sichuanensis B231]
MDFEDPLDGATPNGQGGIIDAGRSGVTDIHSALTNLWTIDSGCFLLLIKREIGAEECQYSYATLSRSPT